MFVILTYDVNKKRVSKVMKTCRKYMNHVQKSVFEGDLTGAELKRLKVELSRAIDTTTDAVCIYRLESTKYMMKEEIGTTENVQNII